MRDKIVAHDASITESVMLGHYVDETDEELWLKSNRTFDRIASCLPPKVAERYGYCYPQHGVDTVEPLRAAVDRQDWQAVKELLERIGTSAEQAAHP